MSLGKSFDELLDTCQKLTLKSVMDAIEYINKNGVPPGRKPRNRAIVYKNIMYPVKYVFELAHNKYSESETKINTNEYTVWTAEDVINAKLPKPLPFKIINLEKDNRKEIDGIYKTESENNKDKDMIKEKSAKNIILYGPPGTGKTYNTIVETMKIIRPDLYKKYVLKPDKEDYKTWYSQKSRATQKNIDDYFKEYTRYEERENINIFDVTNEKELNAFKKDLKNTEYYKSQKGTEFIDTLVNNYLKFYSDFKENKLSYDCLKEEFNKLKQNHQIEFVTFHQSYSYEEFVEGIKPDLEEESLRYKLEDGIFKNICNDIFEHAYEKFNKYIENKDLKLKTSRENKEFTVKTQKTSDGLVIIPTDGNQTENYIKKEELKNIQFMNNRYGYAESVLKYINDNFIEPHILIIDEINRGNISKIFGELITLIEEDKRENLTVKLPYSQDWFTVPLNLYIIGTMNTADKSLAQLDVALRRRFKFIPVYPQYDKTNDGEIIYHSDFLKSLNEKIFEKKKNADYLIGHSYFMSDDGEPELKDILNNSIIPLLMEYFNGKIEDVKNLLSSVDETLRFDSEYSFGGDKLYYLQVV